MGPDATLLLHGGGGGHRAERRPMVITGMSCADFVVADGLVGENMVEIVFL